MMKEWSWKAILGGCAVDIVGGIMIATAVMIPFAIISTSRGSLANPTQSLTFMLLTAVLGLGMDIVGGYCTAMWAPNRKIAHSAIMGVCSVLSGLLLNIGDQNPYPAWFQMTSILVIPAAMMGGWWRVKTHGSESPLKPEKVPAPTAPIASPFED